MPLWNSVYRWKHFLLQSASDEPFGFDMCQVPENIWKSSLPIPDNFSLIHMSTIFSNFQIDDEWRRLNTFWMHRKLGQPQSKWVCFQQICAATRTTTRRGAVACQQAQPMSSTLASSTGLVTACLSGLAIADGRIQCSWQSGSNVITRLLAPNSIFVRSWWNMDENMANETRQDCLDGFRRALLEMLSSSFERDYEDITHENHGKIYQQFWNLFLKVNWHSFWSFCDMMIIVPLGNLCLIWIMGSEYFSDNLELQDL